MGDFFSIVAPRLCVEGDCGIMPVIVVVASVFLISMGLGVAVGGSRKRVEELLWLKTSAVGSGEGVHDDEKADKGS